MSSGALSRRKLLWVAFVVFCTLAMAYTPLTVLRLPVVGHITYYGVLLLAAALLGSGTLLHVAGIPERSGARTMCRILIGYLLFELLIVLPVAVWLGTAPLTWILDAMMVRFTWLLFPVALTLCADDQTRRTAAAVVAVAAACLAVWGVYLAATGGGGYFLEDGNLRYRVLYGGATLLFAWPFALALSAAVPRRYAVALLGVSLVGLTLTNHRSGLIAFAIAGLFCLAMSRQSRRLLAWIAPVALIAALGWLLWGQVARDVFGYTLTHLFDTSAGTGADRVARWRLAWDFFAAHPFNDFVWSWRRYLVNLQGSSQATHNFVLEIATDEGVAGLVFVGSILTMSLGGAWNWIRKDAEALAIFAYLIAFLVFVFANADWYLTNSLPLFVGAVAALVSRTDQLRAAGEVLDANESA